MGTFNIIISPDNIFVVAPIKLSMVGVLGEISVCHQKPTALVVDNYNIIKRKNGIIVIRTTDKPCIIVNLKSYAGGIRVAVTKKRIGRRNAKAY